MRSMRVSKGKVFIADRYNHNMGGVDKADQYSVYYSFGRRIIWKVLVLVNGGGIVKFIYPVQGLYHMK